VRRIGAALVACGWMAAALSAQGLAIVSTTVQPGILMQPFSQSLLAAGGQRPYTWTATGALPPGLTLSADGAFTGTPTAAGTFKAPVTLTDARVNTASQTITIVIVPPVNDLAIVTKSLPAGSVGQSYSQPVQASGGVPPYQWNTLQTLPAGLSLDAASGVVSGTPAATGSFAVTVTVTDSVKSSVTAMVTLRVVNVNAQLTITTVAPLFAGVAGQAYAQAFSASGGTLPYSWSMLSGDTDGLTLNSAGVLQGVPAAAGSFPFSVQVADAAGLRASQSYTLIVAGPPLALATTGSLPGGTVGAGYRASLPLIATGGTLPYTWSVSPATPAPGLTFSADDQSIAGKPAAAGTFTITAQVRDASGNTATRALTLVITAGELRLTSERQLPDAQWNEAYSFTASAEGGTPPYRWSASGLPAGVAINAATGQVGGTPGAAGDFPIALTVVDAALTAVSDRFTLTVRLPRAPAITLAGLPATASPASQFPIQVGIDSPYAVAITGEATLTFAPDAGPVDRTVQFASGGTTAAFTIPAGSTAAISTAPLAIQTGTAAGTVSVSVRLQAGAVDLATSAQPMVGRVAPAAPVIGGVQLTRKSDGLTIAVSGYATAREVTQAVFTFKAAAGQTLQSAAQTVTIPVDTLFGPWFQDAANSAFGTQFIYSQPFTVQGDATAVVPDTVTLTNRLGSVTFTIPK
jgi:hypothetical protein